MSFVQVGRSINRIRTGESTNGRRFTDSYRQQRRCRKSYQQARVYLLISISPFHPYSGNRCIPDVSRHLSLIEKVYSSTDKLHFRVEGT